MTSDDHRPELNLKAALRAAVYEDDLNNACRTLQDALGITDGGLAGISFSDFGDIHACGRTTWSRMSVSERHDKLVSYIKSEIDFMNNPGDLPDIDLPGFYPYHTGGGCMALAKHLPDKTYWLITNESGAYIPSEGDNIIVGHHDPSDQTVIFEAAYSWFDLDREALIKRVKASSRPYGPYDRSGMADVKERRAFIEEQEQEDEQAFEAFLNSRRQMSSREFGRSIGDAMWEDYPEETFLVYDTSWWIGVNDDGRHHLILGNQTWITDQNTTLQDLERELFNFAKENS